MAASVSLGPLPWRSFLLWLVALAIAIESEAGDYAVVPADRANKNGDYRELGGFDSPGVMEFVYGARNFSGPVVITGVAFRLPPGGGPSTTVVFPNLKIQMTTYSGTTDFASFYRDYWTRGDLPAQFDAPITFNLTDLPGSAVNPFEMVIPFATPFTYDPSTGALLLRFAPAQTGRPTYGSADGAITGDSSWGYTSQGLPTPISGGIYLGIPVTRFEFFPIPEPSTTALLALAAAAILSLLPRRRPIQSEILKSQI